MDTTLPPVVRDRSRGDLCPGVFRPWPADDGLLVRLRLVGGQLSGTQFDSLLAVSERFGDGAVHLTRRANLQVRGLPGDQGLSAEVVAAFESTGLVPSRDHELIRNILVSPQSGYAGGRADLRPVATELDQLLRADPMLGALPGRFGFVLDDGRGDLVATPADLGVVALDAERGQLRIGDAWGPILSFAAVPGALVDLARKFLGTRGSGPAAPWHVRELAELLAPHAERSGEAPCATAPLAHGQVRGGVHVAAPDGILTRAATAPLLAEPTLIVTPWRGIFVPTHDASPAAVSSKNDPSPKENS